MNRKIAILPGRDLLPIRPRVGVRHGSRDASPLARSILDYLFDQKPTKNATFDSTVVPSVFTVPGCGFAYKNVGSLKGVIRTHERRPNAFCPGGEKFSAVRPMQRGGGCRGGGGVGRLARRLSTGCAKEPFVAHLSGRFSCLN